MAVLSAAALAAGIITGCGGASDHTGGESSKAVAGSVTLDFFQMKNEAKSVYDEIIANFTVPAASLMEKNRGALRRSRRL